VRPCRDLLPEIERAFVHLYYEFTHCHWPKHARTVPWHIAQASGDSWLLLLFMFSQLIVNARRSSIGAGMKRTREVEPMSLALSLDNSVHRLRRFELTCAASAELSCIRRRIRSRGSARSHARRLPAHVRRVG
jgi:hypothetical protein